MLSLGQLYTDDDTNDNDNNTNDDDNNTQRTNHNCIGSLACMPNEPKCIAKGDELYQAEQLSIIPIGNLLKSTQTRVDRPNPKNYLHLYLNFYFIKLYYVKMVLIIKDYY